jgi:hypothetical protein
VANAEEQRSPRHERRGGTVKSVAMSVMSVHDTFPLMA